MGLEQRSYSILIVSASENFNTSLFSLLAELGGCRPHTVENINSAKRALAERMYDFVIINSPLPDESGIRFAIDACSFRGTVVRH